MKKCALNMRPRANKFCVIMRIQGVKTVASIVDCTLDDIKIVRLQPDQSFIIIITMRAELISILKDTDPHYLRKLLQFNVDWIQIEKCVVKIVTGIVMKATGSTCCAVK